MAARSLADRSFSTAEGSIEVSVLNWDNRTQATQRRLVEHGESLPCCKKLRILTGSKAQEAVSVHIDHVHTSNIRTRVANLRIGPIAYRRRGYPFLLEFQQRFSGIVEMVAHDEVTGDTQSHFADPFNEFHPPDQQRRQFAQRAFNEDRIR